MGGVSGVRGVGSELGVRIGGVSTIVGGVIWLIPINLVVGVSGWMMVLAGSCVVGVAKGVTIFTS